SNQKQWHEMLNLTNSIIEQKTNKNELIQKANIFGNQDNKNLQIICILGYIFYSRNEEGSIIQLINTFHYLTKTYKQQNSVIKFILVPFVRLVATDTIKKSFIGAKVDLDL